MARESIVEIYARHIKPLSLGSRLRLLELMALDLLRGNAGRASGSRSLLELEGLGAEIWRGVDPEAYVRGLREEWDERP